MSEKLKNDGSADYSTKGVSHRRREVPEGSLKRAGIVTFGIFLDAGGDFPPQLSVKNKPLEHGKPATLKNY